MKSRWVTTKQKKNSENNFIIVCTDKCTVEECFLLFMISEYTKFETYFGLKTNNYTEKLLIYLPFTAIRDYKSDFDSCSCEIRKDENFITILAKDNSNIHIPNFYIEFHENIEYKSYYKQIEFPIYYPIASGNIYQETKEIPHIFKGKIEKIIYPKIESLEITFCEKNGEFEPNFKESFPTPDIVRDNGMTWFTGKGKSHTDLHISFLNKSDLFNKEKESYICGVLTAVYLSLLVYFATDIISLIW